MQRLQELGTGVPGDVSVVGADNLEISAISRPALTTFAHPIREVGIAAGQMLLDMVSGRDVKDITLQTEIYLRESTAAPR
jgi:LacI family transcriptional regulator